MRMFLLLVAAAVLEVSGDALIRKGLANRGALLVLAGGAVLVAYGLMVNLTRLDFSRLMGLYIVLFFVVAQGVAVLIFRETLSPPVIAGGLLIVAGGLTMTLWHG